MSRSKRKPYFTEGYGSPDKARRKRAAARAVRAEKEVASGKAYRKVYSPYDICDFKFYSPESRKASRK